MILRRRAGRKRVRHAPQPRGIDRRATKPPRARPDAASHPSGRRWTVPAYARFPPSRTVEAMRRPCSRWARPREGSASMATRFGPWRPSNIGIGREHPKVVGEAQVVADEPLTASPSPSTLPRRCPRRRSRARGLVKGRAWRTDAVGRPVLTASTPLRGGRPYAAFATDAYAKVLAGGLLGENVEAGPPRFGDASLPSRNPSRTSR